ncbi:MAG: PqqD family protein [Actinomycetota bacterium]|nr:PqqD family protein [Actinomycetota bacterium]
MDNGEIEDPPTFEIPPQVLYREVDGQMVLLNLETEQYFGLNEVGAQIVTRLTEQPLEQALARLTDDFDVDARTLHRDVDKLVGELMDAGLLKRTASSG